MNCVSDPMLSRLKAMFSVFMIEACFGLLIFCELIFLHTNLAEINLWKLLFQIPRLAHEHLVLSLIFSVASLFFLQSKLKSLLIAGTASFINIYLIFNEIYYGLFLSHFSIAASEGQIRNLGALSSSLLEEIDSIFFINILIVVITAVLLFASINNNEKIRHRNKLFSPAYLTLAILMIWIITAAIYPSSHQSPNFNYLTPIFAASHKLAPDASLDIPTHELFQPVAKPAPYIDKENNQLSIIAPQLNTIAKTQPNIVFITLESVGTEQLMPNGKFDSLVSPFLASKEQHSLIYNNLYAIFPSTARSHIPMLTGGNIITWGSVYDEFSYPYTENTLPGDFKAAGYRTGFFSSGDLSYENRFAFYKNLPFDRILGSNTLSKEELQAHKLNSWGVTEEFAWRQALNWLDTPSEQSQPFFLHYMTVATHHPYTIPKWIRAPFKGLTKEEKYQNALFYTDQLIQQMVADLTQRGMIDNTLLVITGDHGEAFGKRHPYNYTHKNFLYEENLRTFLIIIFSSHSNMPALKLERAGSVGDIAPTVNALAGIHSDYRLAQNLLSSRYQEKLNFFHKGTFPHQWGVRDGPWKFIENIRDGHPQLYNLADDPYESKNIASAHPHLVDSYHGRAEIWFLRQNQEFRQALGGYPQYEQEGLKAADLKKPGPKKLLIGIMDKGRFISAKQFSMSDHITSWIRLVPYEEDTRLDYWWSSPSGQQIHISPFIITSGWTTARLPFPRRYFKEIETGTWKLAIKHEGLLLLEAEFTIH